MRTFYLRFCVYSVWLILWHFRVSSNLPMLLVSLYTNWLYENQSFKVPSHITSATSMWFGMNVWIYLHKMFEPITLQRLFNGSSKWHVSYLVDIFVLALKFKRIIKQILKIKKPCNCCSKSRLKHVVTIQFYPGW